MKHFINLLRKTKGNFKKSINKLCTNVQVWLGAATLQDQLGAVTLQDELWATGDNFKLSHVSEPCQKRCTANTGRRITSYTSMTNTCHVHSVCLYFLCFLWCVCFFYMADSVTGSKAHLRFTMVAADRLFAKRNRNLRV